MAEDLRPENTDKSLVGKRIEGIVAECRRQEESCLYTSTTLYIWLRIVRRNRQVFVVAPIVLGAIAGFSALKEVAPDWVIALLTLAASLFPALTDAMKIETSVDEIAKTAADYKALQDRFRRVATITTFTSVDDAETALAELMDRMDVVRSISITPPEWAFKEAQDKIKKGHYTFDVDTAPSN